MISIAGLDKRKLIRNLFYSHNDMNYDADDIIDEYIRNGYGYVERIVYVIFKTDFSNDTVNTYHYNQYVKKEGICDENGRDDYFERIVLAMYSDLAK